MSEKDPWDVSSGLFSDYEGTVIDAWFGTDPNNTFNPDQLFLWLKMFTDHPDHETQEERYATGPKWTTLDGGESAEHPDGAEVQFNGNTQYGKFITAAVSVGGGKEFVDNVLRPRGTPKEAKVWIGTKWYMEATVSEARKLADGRELPRSSKNFPVKFLGMEGESTAAVGTGSVGVGTAPVKPTVLDSLDEGTLTSLREVASKCDKFPAFVDAAMEIPGLLSNNDLVIALANPQIYEYLRG